MRQGEDGQASMWSPGSQPEGTGAQWCLTLLYDLAVKKV